MQDELKPCSFRQVDNHGRILCHLIKGGDREVSVNLCRACPVSQINCQHLRAGLEKKVSTPITVRFATGRVEVWDDAPPMIDFKQAACAAKTMPIHSARDCAGCPIRLPNVIPQSAIQVAHRTKQNAPVVAQDAIATRTIAPPRATRPSARVAQPVAQMPVTPVEPTAQPIAIDVGAANDLIARAQSIAARKAQEKKLREAERLAEQENERAAQPEAKPKIIQMKAWLESQVNKKQRAAQDAKNAYKPQAVNPDADGVSDIVYAPLGMQNAQVYQETIDYERCVGWTD